MVILVAGLEALFVDDTLALNLAKKIDREALQATPVVVFLDQVPFLDSTTIDIHPTQPVPVDVS
jgi:hypothetical protein